MVIARHVLTFVYFCDASQTYDIHEVSTGLRVAGGFSEQDAMLNAQSFFHDMDQDLFFEQMRKMGPHTQYVPRTITYSDAMERLRAGTEQHQREAIVRNIMENKNQRN